MKLLMYAIALFVILPAPLYAGKADIVGAEITPLGGGSYRIDATVRHDDEGWDHYADRWEVLAPDRKIIGTRVLLHPHVEEQPFTRRLSDLTIPSETRKVIIRAHDSVHGYGGKEREVEVPRTR